MSTETWMEWGVLWLDDDEVEPCPTRESAETVARLHASWPNRVVSRTITAGSWAEPPDPIWEEVARANEVSRGFRA